MRNNYDLNCETYLINCIHKAIYYDFKALDGSKMSFVKFDYIEPVPAMPTVNRETKDKLEVDRLAKQPEKIVVDAALANRP